MKLFGSELAKQIVKNAQTAGQYLYENGVKVLCEHKGFTRSHQIAVDIRAFGGGNKIAQDLEDANIILNKNLLPYDDQSSKGDPSGLTRRLPRRNPTRLQRRRHQTPLRPHARRNKGKRKPSEVQKDVIALRKEFAKIKYGFQNVEEA